MIAAQTFDLAACLARARSASRKLASADRNGALYRIADALEANYQAILTANQQDVSAETARGTKASLIDRLTLTEARLAAMAAALRQIAQLPDPLFRVLEGWRLENGLKIEKVTVPFGVIGIIYESRPNVTVDAAALTLKAGSSAVLRGSANALASNRVLVQVMRAALAEAGLPEDAITLIDSPERELVTELLESRGKVDLVIPRGGAGLIQHVVNTAKVPTIETGIGNCHLFVDASADLANALEVTLNAKVQRPGVCNAIETLLVHRDIANAFLPRLAEALRPHNVTLHGCETTCQRIPEALPATEADWQTEYLDYELAIRVVDTLDDAIEHITSYGSMHSEAILTRDMAAARRFQQEVDAAAVYVNASTRFTDGFEFGFGAEIGISTQKLHARGPMGLAAMVTYKYLIEGEGQIRS
jgi:glutamate-5-semialdehyde dehydrogenase